MTKLHKENIGIDILTVSNELRRIGMLPVIGGDVELINLMQKIGSSAHAEYHARIILQKYILRELINTSSFVINEAYNKDPDVFALIDSIEATVTRIYKEAVIQSTQEDSDDSKRELQDKIDAVAKGEPPGVQTGLKEFDNWGGGFHKRELITIAARPGMGKTTAILSIAANASLEKGIPMAFFSLEMTKTDLKNRLASRALKIDYKKIRNGTLTESEIKEVMWYYDVIDESKLTIIDRINVHEKLCKQLKDLVLKKGIKMAIIDYVQLMKLQYKSSDRTADLAVITRDLKALANELNIPIVIIAQLSRKVDDRPSKRPVLADLKQSGSIEEDSDTVIFILRMAYYDTISNVLIPPQIIGKTEWIVAKGRNTGTRDFWTFLDFNNYDFRSL
jgi:replicative DNA helicase